MMNPRKKTWDFTENRGCFYIISVFIFLSLIISFPVTSFAEIPVPDSKKDTLPALERHLKEREKERKAVRRELQATKNEIVALKKKMINLGEEIQNTESKMQSLESHVSALNAEKSELEEKLETDHKKTARLALALQRISQIPSEALIARPSTPIRTVQSGILIKSALPLIQKEAQGLSKKLSRLQTVTAQLAIERRKLLQTRQEMTSQKAEMKAYLDNRQAFYTQRSNEYEHLSQEISHIAAQASTLGDLIEKLRQREKKKETEISNLPRPIKKAVLKVPENYLRRYEGDPRLPVSGVIQTGFGDLDRVGAHSRGLKIRTRDDSLVVAPLSGRVKFCGTFGRFGHVIIIEHEDDYHSLITGVSDVNCATGQHVITGEPLATMGPSISGGKPVLYYELRHKGQPVDPSNKIGGLS